MLRSFSNAVAARQTLLLCFSTPSSRRTCVSLANEKLPDDADEVPRPNTGSDNDHHQQTTSTSSSSAAAGKRIIQLPRGYGRRRDAAEFVARQEMQKQQQQHGATHLVTTTASGLFNEELRPLPRFVQMLNENVVASSSSSGGGAGGGTGRSLTASAAANGVSAAESIIQEFRDTFRPAAAADEEDGGGSAKPMRHLSQYCGNASDVLPLTTILLRACVDTNDIDTARFLFALLMGEFGAGSSTNKSPAHLHGTQHIPLSIFRLYLIALSRSDTATLQELNVLVRLIGEDQIARSGVMQLCLIECSMRCGQFVSVAAVERALQTARAGFDEHAQEKAVDDEAEYRMKLKDCFACALTSHPDFAVATLLLLEWTKRSQLTEFVAELPLVVRFVRQAANNASAPANLCAELLTLLSNLARAMQLQQEAANPDQPPKPAGGEGSALASQLRVRTLFHCISKSARTNDWASLLTVERLTYNAIMASEEQWLTNNNSSNNNNDESSENNSNNSNNSHANMIARASALGFLGLMRIAAMMNLRQFDKLFSAEIMDSIVRDNFLSSSTSSADVPAPLFKFSFPGDPEGAASCPFMLHSVLPFRGGGHGGRRGNSNNNDGNALIVEQEDGAAARELVVHEIGFPLADLPPMASILGAARTHADSVVEAWLKKTAAASSNEGATHGLPPLHPAFTAILIVASCAASRSAATKPLTNVLLPLLESQVISPESFSGNVIVTRREKEALVLLACRCIEVMPRLREKSGDEADSMREALDLLAFDVPEACGGSKSHYLALARALRAHGMTEAVNALKK